MRRRLGKFSICAAYVRWNAWEVAEIFAELELVPFRVEYLFATGCIEYRAFSSKFRLIGPDSETPEYLFRHMVDAVDHLEDEEVLVGVAKGVISVISRRYFPPLAAAEGEGGVGVEEEKVGCGCEGEFEFEFEVKDLDVSEISA